MNGNTFATPSEDDFDDDDDELLIAASQQVEKKIAKEKVWYEINMVILRSKPEIVFSSRVWALSTFIIYTEAF